MTEEKRALKVFLCHAHSDKDAVKALYARLKREGVDVWLDKEKLLPGADWELEIRKAVREADVVVVCLSKQFNQEGFRQKEVRIALDAAMEKPEGEIFIIPARLEECDTPANLSKWHWVDLFEEDSYEMLLRALRARANRIGTNLQIRRSRKLGKPKAKTSKSLNAISSIDVSFGNTVSDSVIAVGSRNDIKVSKFETSRPLINLQPLPVEQTDPLWLMFGDLDEEQSEEKYIYVDQIKPTTHREYDPSEVNCVISHKGVIFKNQFAEEELQRLKREGHLVIKNRECGTSTVTQPWVTFLSAYSLRNVGSSAAINLFITVSVQGNSSRYPHIITLLPGEQVSLRLLIDILRKQVLTILGSYLLVIEYGDISKRYRQEYKFKIEREEENAPVTVRLDLSANQPAMNSVKRK